MSRALAPSERRPLDAYWTPEPVARACLDTLGSLEGLRVWEPHCGGGAFVRVALAKGAVVFASDADPLPVSRQDKRSAHFQADFLTHRPGESVDWIVGNPPFTYAEEHVRRALGHHPAFGVAFLLRLAFLESAKRAPFWREHPPTRVLVLSERPSFTDGGTDSAAYGWFIWQRGAGQPATLGWISWRDVGGAS